MYPLTPRRCKVAITSGSSASEKPTLARAVKCFSPKYTASAPASMAARSCGQYPAGLMTSGLRRGPLGTASSGAPPGPTTESACRREGDNDRIPDPGRDQLLPSVERHDAIGDPGRVPHFQEFIPPGLRPDRADHTDLATPGVALAAGRRPVHGPSADALLAAGGDDVRSEERRVGEECRSRW